MANKPLMKRVTVTLTQEQLRLIRSTNIGANDAEAIRGLAMAWLAEKSMLSTTAKNRMAAPAEIVSSKITKSPHEGEQHDLKVTCPFCGNIEIQYGIAGDLSMAEIMNDTEECPKCGREFKLRLVANMDENTPIKGKTYTIDKPDEDLNFLIASNCPVCGNENRAGMCSEDKEQQVMFDTCQSCRARYKVIYDYKHPTGHMPNSKLKAFFEGKSVK